MQRKGIVFSEAAQKEFAVISGAVREISGLAYDAFMTGNLSTAMQVEPLEQVIDDLKEQLRTHHILRLQQGNCGIDAGFIWSDLLTNLERVGDHCSNIACCMIDSAHHNMNMHETLQGIRKGSEEFNRAYAACKQRYFVSGT